jgi:hypothetical protein
MKRVEPDLVSRRTFDDWAEGSLLGCADDGLITLPQRVGNQKQPKPTDIAALRKITWRQLRAIAKKFRSMEKLRAALRPPMEREENKMLKALSRAIVVLETEHDIESECIPLLAKLSDLIAVAISTDAKSPNHRPAVGRTILTAKKHPNLSKRKVVRPHRRNGNGTAKLEQTERK